MIYGLDPAGFISLTPGPGADAMACVLMNKAYLGICFSDQHKTALEKHIKKQILRAWSDPKSPIYEPAYHALLVKLNKATEGPATEPPKKRKRDAADQEGGKPAKEGGKAAKETRKADNAPETEKDDDDESETEQQEDEESEEETPPKKKQNKKAHVQLKKKAKAKAQKKKKPTVLTSGDEEA